MHDLMIDLETLSTRHDAAILSIAAVKFDLATGNIGPSYQDKIDLTDHPKYGHISIETVAWWLKQSDKSRQQLFTGKTKELGSALINLLDFSKGAKTLWSNGSSFDLTILRNAYDRYQYTVPWQYWQERDCRTIVDIAERMTGINTAKTSEFTGTKHDALSDAIFQAHYVSRAFQLISTR